MIFFHRRNHKKYYKISLLRKKKMEFENVFVTLEKTLKKGKRKNLPKNLFNNLFVEHWRIIYYIYFKI
jgi:hypothetical protein